ncbi:MAG: alpha/beta hydrolase, partial [Isosphaeraceae bacterium]
MRLGRLVLASAMLSLAASTTPVRSLAASPNATTVTYESPSVGRTLRCRVILPADYEGSNRRYPVLYLLHGFSGDFTSWSKHGVEESVQGYPLIVVLPDGGNSWYVNWSETGPDRREAWEDAQVKDLVGHVDAHYRTIASREGRAINGLSMGGYGALTVGLRHPETFCSVGSSAGALG